MDWKTGVSVIQQWVAIEALEIRPGTVLAVQLGKMTKADRQASRRSVILCSRCLEGVIGSRGAWSTLLLEWLCGEEWFLLSVFATRESVLLSLKIRCGYSNTDPDSPGTD
jgi:hypothetical protein